MDVMDDLTHLEARQRQICQKYGSVFVASPAELKVGISANSKQGVMPLNGLRHRPAGDTTGWYIWCGEEFKPIRRLLCAASCCASSCVVR
jgi:hypothetical protein